MSRRCHRSLAVLLVASFAAFTACADKSPTAPSPVTPDPPASSPGPAPAPAPAPSPAPAGSATISGQVVGSVSALDASPLAAGVPGITVTVVGTSLTATADGTGRFALSNVPSGDQQLSFSGAGTDATLRLSGIAEQERIEITVAVSGRSAEVVGQARDNGAEAQVEGRVTAVDPPARTIQVGEVSVAIPQGTPIRNATRSLSFADLHVADAVHVRGTRSGSTVSATEVTVRQSTNNPGGGNQVDETVRGAIASVSGSCPEVRLSVNGKTVQLTTATQYLLGATCRALARGVIVEAEGPASGTVVTARTIKIEDNAGGGGGNGADVSVTGAIAGLGGSCPNRTFSIGSRAIVLTASTQYLLGASCAALANGATVQVEGPASGSTITARKIKIEDGPAGDTVLRGVVSRRGGTCPAITFTVQGRTVVTTSGTQFRKLTCEQVVNGTTVEAEGTLTGSTLAAKKVQLQN